MIRQSYVLPLNPEPWKTPPYSPVRRGGKLIVRPGRDEVGHITKEAIREELLAQGAEVLPAPYRIRLLFWRSLEQYKTASGRAMTRKWADATNMQKLTEDALQGVLIENDRDVRRITSQIVSQVKNGPALIVILIEADFKNGYFDEPIIPACFDQGGELTTRINHALSTECAEPQDNSWGDEEIGF